MLEGIASAPRGVPQIEVSFDIDANGILNVKAIDKGTGKEQKITITASSGLSDDDIEKMKKDAEENAESDKQKREAVEVKNEAETLVYQAEKLISENKEKIGEESVTKLEAGIADLKKAIESDDATEMKAKTEALQKDVHEASTALYQQGEAPEGAATDAETEESAESKDENVVDAEYSDVAEESEEKQETK